MQQNPVIALIRPTVVLAVVLFGPVPLNAGISGNRVLG
jgi:hypothetical protein